ncbi:isoprenylcysteine carboxylmethyltransferase family protein [Ponticoccus sp. SC2-23]|uniref:methyltransferase family protein n=1 Tax=Alexandriicola marinus TaxID=2081710 RepID=UPI000FDBD00A|nr:isoprenylcysteine carboxylmethyltransferase family protein [Alexandriicola marinus]MBM1219447.1 isoprenylcysteine carboxylmethyltransferase family protein [Ponticoccus sp. SC6-9]MBM1223481.1 isoprenylcysteine carboxylmethyltransferase family protein [Ponticoccus sp. SC6-15]MBM1229260.1 isoprenylcysteine carboxylmethyltransferase family protein [Ponticoccus sp. SC6-38]MBM1232447.1 isoprenylcysteine carboxylmethyltransferase family protein [Ponticoccus sp. SC6-45]MBM1237603.1 isoprenylcystein
MKWIDLPPIWLAGFIVCTFALGRAGIFGGVFGDWADLPGAVLVGLGVLLMLLAVVQMTRHRTTVIPHRDADALVTTGIFGLSRNPIYLGDALVLAGAVLIFGPPVACLLVPLFMLVIRQRFILPEEARLSRRFGSEFESYARRVRRWI